MTFTLWARLIAGLSILILTSVLLHPHFPEVSLLAFILIVIAIEVTLDLWRPIIRLFLPKWGGE